MYLEEFILFLFHAQEVCCFFPVFTVLSAFASLLFSLPAVLTHAAPVPWISQDCLVRLHILSALPCLVYVISTSFLPSLWSSVSQSSLVFSALSSLLSFALCCLSLLLLVPWWMIYKSFTAYTWHRWSGIHLHGFFFSMEFCTSILHA